MADLTFPESLRHAPGRGFRDVEPAGAGDADIVAEAGAGVPELEGRDAEIPRLRRIEIPEGLRADAEGEFGGDDGEGADDLVDAPGTADGEGIRVSLVAHGEEQAGESAAVVGVEVGQEDRFDLPEGESGLFDGELGPFAAVDEEPASLVAHIAAAEEAVEAGNGSAGSGQANVKHKFSFQGTREGVASRKWLVVSRTSEE